MYIVEESHACMHALELFVKLFWLHHVTKQYVARATKRVAGRGLVSNAVLENLVAAVRMDCTVPET